MKTSLTVTLVALLTLIFMSQANAGTRPSFYLDACAWDATHIVVVTEGERTDGQVSVLESWKGDLKPGDNITVPELAAFEPQSSRIIDPGTDGPVKCVTG